VAGEVAAVDAEAAAATLEQASQHVVVLLVAAERERRVARQRVGDAFPGLLVNQRRSWNGDPLLRRAGPPGSALRTTARFPAGLPGNRILEAVGICGADVNRVGQDVVDDGGRPLLTARPCHPGAGVQAFHALPNGKPFPKHPGVKLADHGSLRRVDDEPGRHGALPPLIAIAVGDLGADDVSLTRLLQLATPEPLGQHGTLVLSDRALDLQQQLVVRIFRNRAVQEHDLAASAPKLLQEQDLIGVPSGEPVGAEYGYHVDSAVADSVPERV
jgi:hypothetical protein